MRIGVAATKKSLDAEVCEQFGRCPYLVIVDSKTLAIEAFHNPGNAIPGGAGPTAVQELVSHGAEAVLAGEFGPKAKQALDAAGVRYDRVHGKVSEAVSAWTCYASDERERLS